MNRYDVMAINRSRPVCRSCVYQYIFPCACLCLVCVFINVSVDVSVNVSAIVSVSMIVSTSSVVFQWSVVLLFMTTVNRRNTHGRILCCSLYEVAVIEEDTRLTDWVG